MKLPLHKKSRLNMSLVFGRFKKVIYKNFEMGQAVFSCLCVTHRNKRYPKESSSKTTRTVSFGSPVHDSSFVTPLQDILTTGRYIDTR